MLGQRAAAGALDALIAQIGILADVIGNDLGQGLTCSFSHYFTSMIISYWTLANFVFFWTQIHADQR